MALSKLLIKVLEPKRTKKLEEALENIDFSKIKNLKELQKIQENLYYDDCILPEDNDHSMLRGGIIGLLGSLFTTAAASVCYYAIGNNEVSADFVNSYSVGILLFGGSYGSILGSGIFSYFSFAINKEIKKRVKRAGIIEYKKLKREKSAGYYLP